MIINVDVGSVIVNCKFIIKIITWSLRAVHVLKIATKYDNKCRCWLSHC